MKVVVGGQLKKNEIKNIINKNFPDVEVEIMTDLNAAFAMKAGKFDLYLGACDTGGGGALAMAISLLGANKTASIATQSSKKTEEEIIKMIKDGAIAFGFVWTEVDYATKTIVKNFIKEKN